jgi:redox-regulated HSP33 family molecular chaperone
MEKRETLEKQAIDEVCECQYYDLADTIDETSDEDLLALINHLIPCEICGQ